MIFSVNASTTAAEYVQLYFRNCTSSKCVLSSHFKSRWLFAVFLSLTVLHIIRD